MTEPVVHIVDDDEAMRDSLLFLLDAEGLKARGYESAPAFLDRVGELEPGCILTDVRMPQVNGLEMVRRLKAAGVTLPVIVMTGHADLSLAIEAMRAGVIDFLEKPFEDEALLSALRQALSAGAEDLRREQDRLAVQARRAALSAREGEVLEGLLAGKPNKIIAFDLGISPRTVEIYRANVMTKMQAASLSELVRMCLLAEAKG
ncbi:response regulator [Caulobacter sp. SLTY]|uniref:response regulator FixJ n=1 Tax=Caulobacter sp. SLTY TaxID=2683262 RepID=UPI001412A20F|nr:response regulator FixJ [Caulobacter sp. SLTY]NBB17443.1 response regulator [Caulobacter sp. SLTY]